MKKLIRKILREQLENEEDFSPVIPIFNYAKKYKDVYAYFDNLGLVKGKPMHYEGIIFTYPNAQKIGNYRYGILGWRNDGTLYIDFKLIDEICFKFNSIYHTGFLMNKSDSQSIIGRWVSDRYQLEVRDIAISNEHEQAPFRLATDSN